MTRTTDPAVGAASTSAAAPAPSSPDSDLRLPSGFRPMPRMGEFIGVNGPLCLRHEGDLVRLGFVSTSATPTRSASATAA